MPGDRIVRVRCQQRHRVSGFLQLPVEPAHRSLPVERKGHAVVDRVEGRIRRANDDGAGFDDFPVFFPAVPQPREIQQFVVGGMQVPGQLAPGQFLPFYQPMAGTMQRRRLSGSRKLGAVATDSTRALKVLHLMRGFLRAHKSSAHVSILSAKSVVWTGSG